MSFSCLAAGEISGAADQCGSRVIIPLLYFPAEVVALPVPAFSFSYG